MARVRSALTTVKAKLAELWEWSGRPVTYRGVLASYGACFVLAASGVGLYIKFNAASAQRRDQSCAQDERAHKAKVDGLRQTYALLENPAQRQLLGAGLVKLVVLNLPQQETDARTDEAPAYCDEPGIGLPEPDPVLPKRRDFSYLIDKP